MINWRRGTRGAIAALPLAATVVVWPVGSAEAGARVTVARRQALGVIPSPPDVLVTRGRRHALGASAPLSHVRARRVL